MGQMVYVGGCGSVGKTVPSDTRGPQLDGPFINDITRFHICDGIQK